MHILQPNTTPPHFQITPGNPIREACGFESTRGEPTSYVLGARSVRRQRYLTRDRRNASAGPCPIRPQVGLADVEKWGYLVLRSSRERGRVTRLKIDSCTPNTTARAAASYLCNSSRPRCRSRYERDTNIDHVSPAATMAATHTVGHSSTSHTTINVNEPPRYRQVRKNPLWFVVTVQCIWSLSYIAGCTALA